MSLVGGHVDFNDGLVLPVAVDREVRVFFCPRDEARIQLRSNAFGEFVAFEIDALSPGSIRGWASYPAAVAWALARAGRPLNGLDGVIDSSLPMAAGLGSSAALVVAFAAALCRASRLDLPKVELARFCHEAENEFVGVHCGMMDPLVSACARAGHALFIDCQRLETRQVAVPVGVRVVVLHTGIERRLSSSEFNRRHEECREALRRLSEIEPTIASYRDVRLDQLERLLPHLPPRLARRARHVVTEIERVREGVDALARSDLERFGELMFASHRSSRENYESSCPELDALVELARGAPGAIGARLTGAGFGGCTVNLVAAAAAEEFVQQVSAGYARRFGRTPRAFISEATSGATVRRAE